MGNESDLMLVMAELMPIMQKYSEVKPEFLDIKVEKYNEGTIIKIRSDKKDVTEALADILVSMSKMQTDVKVSCKVDDFTK